MSRSILALFFATLALAFGAGDAPRGLQGRIEGRTDISPTGIFRVTLPVLPELGGEVSDTANVVTFEDAFNTHATIAAFPQDATQRWEMSTRGMRDYLIYFFSNYVLADFKQAFEGVQIESAKFGALPSVPDGALISYILIPGGSMFRDKIPQLEAGARAPVAKRGTLLFVSNGHIILFSIELAERVIEGRTYKKTTAEEDEILRQRLTDLLGKTQFARPPAGAAAAAPAPAATK